MYDYLIKKFVENLKQEDIYNYAKKEGILLTKDENNIIYNCIKDNWRTFYYGNPRKELDDLKKELKEETYNKIEKIYIEAKKYIEK